MGLAQLEQLDELGVGKGACDAPDWDRIDPQFQLEIDLSIPLKCRLRRAHAFGSSNEHNLAVGQAQKFWNRADECMAASIRLQCAIGKGDDWLTAFQDGAIGQLKLLQRGVGFCLCRIDPIMNHTD